MLKMGTTKQALLAFVAEHPGATLAEASEALGVRVNGIHRHARDLREAGLLAKARPREFRSLRLAGERRLTDAEVTGLRDRLVSQDHLLAVAFRQCRALLDQLGSVSSVSEVADVYQGLEDLTGLLGAWPRRES